MTFEEWFTTHEQNTGNNKLFKNKKGMKLVWDFQQVKIDELMLEYCPDEMYKEQIEEWGRNQRPLRRKHEISIR